MGCTTSLVTISNASFGKDNNVHGFNKDGLTNEDRRIVKRTWKALSTDVVELGVKVLLNLFKLNPETKRYFPVEHLGEELLTNIRFKSHATRLIQSFQTVIDNIDNLEKNIVPLLLEIGKQHCSFDGFQKVYWESCYEAILQTWKEELQEKFTGPKHKAWSALLVFMISTLKVGYEMENADMLQCPARHKQKRISAM